MLQNFGVIAIVLDTVRYFDTILVIHLELIPSVEFCSAGTLSMWSKETSMQLRKVMLR